MKEVEQSYISLLQKIKETGVLKQNRTGIDTYSVFNTTWNSGSLLEQGYFPLFTHRNIGFKGALVELFWILGIFQEQNPLANTDRNNVMYLKCNNVHYWDPWADEHGDLGPVYGAQLTEWVGLPETIELNEVNGVDIVYKKHNQILDIIDKLQNNPDDRRLVFSMWNPGMTHLMALPPCHWGGEFYSEPQKDGTRKLHLRWIQRSCDMPIGVPYDIAIYSLLLLMIAKLTNHTPGTVYGLFGDSHIYENQMDGVNQIIKSYNDIYNPPRVIYTGDDNIKSLYDFKLDDFQLVEYKTLGRINMPVAV